MPTVLRWGLENAAAATAMTLVVAVLGRALRGRPAVAHALWVLVLVKLVTPAPWRCAAPARVAERWGGLPGPRGVESAPARVEDIDRLLGRAAAGGRLEGFLIDRVNEGRPAAGPGLPWGALALAWGTGSLLTLGIVAVRVSRFRRVLALATPAPGEVCGLVNEIAARIGLSRRPKVVTLPGGVPPLVWAFGRVPLLVIPWDLWGRLGPSQHEALLAHELAHLKRGDDRVRWLEHAVAVLYWWLPAVWWARRALREAEEQCCDAWAVWSVPGAARSYAEALVEAVDFLNNARALAPAGASGFGHAGQLKRRLVMIMRGTARRSLGPGGLWLALGCAAVLLPFSPSWADPPGDTQTPPATAAKGDASGSTGKVDAYRLGILGEGDPSSDVFVLFDGGQRLAIDQPAVARVEEVPPPPDAAMKEAVDRIRKEIAAIRAKKDSNEADEHRAKALEQAVAGLERGMKQAATARAKAGIVVFRETSEAKAAAGKETSKEAAEERAKLRARVDELRKAVEEHQGAVQAAGRRLREAQQRLAEESRKLAEAEGGHAKQLRARVLMAPAEKWDGMVEYYETPTPGHPPIVRRSFTIPGPSLSRDAERRLSELEKKIDRLTEKLEGRPKEAR